MKQINAKLVAVLVLALFFVNVVSAVDFDTEISASDKATFDKILEPVMKIYNLVKYSASAMAVMVLLFAGISYMASGSDPKKRESSKAMAMYVVIGLVVIWAAPLLVDFIVT